jgi:hypothetical protein
VYPIIDIKLEEMVRGGTQVAWTDGALNQVDSFDAGVKAGTEGARKEESPINRS